MKRIRTVLLLASSILAALPFQAGAQTRPAPAAADNVVDDTQIPGLTGQTRRASSPAPAEPSAGLEEIIVTAQRREERLQSVPVSVTAQSGKQLETRQISTVQGLTSVTPSMTRFITKGDPYALAFGLRGVPVSAIILSIDPTVGVYFDGVYLARTVGSGLGMVDMERVEVLNGPQGTLFGRNTVGGAVNLITAKPTDNFEGSVKAGIGNYRSRDFSAVVNVPLGQDVSARMVYSHQEHDGYVRNLFLNQDQNSLNSDYARVTVGAGLGARWNLEVSGDYAHYDADSQSSHLDYLSPSSPLNFLPLFSPTPTDNLQNYVGGDIRKSYSFINDQNYSTNWGARGTLTGELGAATVKSITAYRHVKSITPYDQVGLPYGALIINGAFETQHQFSEELQLFGDALDGRLKWIGGVYYFTESGNTGSNYYALYPLLATGANTSADVKNISRGVFAQVTYEVLPDLRWTGGLRYTQDKRQIQRMGVAFDVATGNELSVGGRPVCTLPAVLAPDPVSCQQVRLTKKAHYFPFTTGLDYQLSRDAMVYAKISRGFRSGGFPPGGGSNPDLYLPYDPEKLTSYEAGFKTEWFGHKLRLNGAVYYSDYKKIQEFITYPTPEGPAPWIKNWGGAHIYGFELQATASIEKLILNANLGYVHGEWTDGPLKIGEPATPGYAGITPNQPYLQTPKITISASADYPFDLGQVGTLNLHADYSYRSKVWYGTLAPSDVASWPHEAQRGYSLVNAVASLELASAPLTLSAWVKNLTDKRYYSSKGDLVLSGLGAVYGYIGDPRTYGMSIAYKFGG